MAKPHGMSKGTSVRLRVPLGKLPAGSLGVMLEAPLAGLLHLRMRTIDPLTDGSTILALRSQVEVVEPFVPGRRSDSDRETDDRRRKAATCSSR